MALRKNAARAFAALLDRRVPGRLKMLALAGVLLVLSPLNVLGYIPLLGLLDDGALLSLLFVWFTRASAPYMNTFEARPIDAARRGFRGPSWLRR